MTRPSVTSVRSWRGNYVSHHQSKVCRAIGEKTQKSYVLKKKIFHTFDLKLCCTIICGPHTGTTTSCRVPNQPAGISFPRVHSPKYSNCVRRQVRSLPAGQKLCNLLQPPEGVCLTGRISQFGKCKYSELKEEEEEEEENMKDRLESAGGEVRIVDKFNSIASILEAIKEAHLFDDEKTSIDMPLNAPLEEVLEAFACLPRVGGTPGNVVCEEQLKSFIAIYFSPAGSDLEPYCPVDYDDNPKDFMPHLENLRLKKWALEVHRFWIQLCRRVSSRVRAYPSQHTLLDLPNAVVIPGERFREVYYWDSYWVIRGLLVSKMDQTAQGVVENLIELGRRHGFIPNGSRSYYLNRSQPPLLSRMVREVHDATGDDSLIAKALPILLQEHARWTASPHAVSIEDERGYVHSLSRFYAAWDKPRPEEHCKDLAAASGMDGTMRSRFFRDVASAAESGWDFSSRWMRDPLDPQSICTTSVIPVDLNAMLYQMEMDVAALASRAHEPAMEAKFLKAAAQRYVAIDALLWDEDTSQWFDYVLPQEEEDGEEEGAVGGGRRSESHEGGGRRRIWRGGRLNKAVYASNFVPIWCGLIGHDEERIEKVIHALENSGLIHPAGIATSLVNTGEQWDFPNAWAPLQDMIICGLDNTGTTRGSRLAADLSKRWLMTNLVAFEATGHMHEKYDVRVIGKVGSGGEYAPQIGFGWTNGVALSFLQRFGTTGDRPLDKLSGKEAEVVAKFVAANSFDDVHINGHHNHEVDDVDSYQALEVLSSPPLPC